MFIRSKVGYLIYYFLRDLCCRSRIKYCRNILLCTDIYNIMNSFKRDLMLENHHVKFHKLFSYGINIGLVCTGVCPGHDNYGVVIVP